MTNGFVALAYDATPGSEIIFQADNHIGYALTVLNSDLSISEEDLALADGESIMEYLSGLTMYRITGQYNFNYSTREALLELSAPQSMDCWLFVYDNVIELYPLNQHDPQPIYYYILEGIDWDHLDSLILASPN